MSVVSISGETLSSPSDPNEEVIEVLEQALTRARNGKTVGLAIVEVDFEGSVDFKTLGTYRPIVLQGALAQLLHDVCNSQ